MRVNELLTSEWCDLLFSQRNKAYGAYVLRSQTGHRFGVSVGIVVALFVLFFVPALVWTLMQKNTPRRPVEPIRTVVKMEGIRLREAQAVHKTVQELRPRVTTQNDDEDVLKIPEREKQAVVFHPDDLTFIPEMLNEIKEDSSLLRRDAADLPMAVATEQTTGVVLDSIAKYPTGIASFMKWLHRTMVYPPECVRQGIEGRVEMAFIVESTGDIADIRVVSGADERLNHEALRVLQMMPKWLPAQRGGQPIRSQVTLPVTFELNR